MASSANNRWLGNPSLGARPAASALHQSLLLLGRLEEATRIRDELEPLASKIGQSYSIARCLITRAWTEFGKAADLAKLETVLQQA